jgi:6-hydroxytryprostatin B O-methyltransferase
LEVATISALTQLGVPDKIPLEGFVSYQNLAQSVQISPRLLKRLVRFAVTVGFLIEDGTGAVGHSAMSAVFIRDPATAGGTRFMCNVGMRGHPYLKDSILMDPTGCNNRVGPTALAFEKDSGEQGIRPITTELIEHPDHSADWQSLILAWNSYPSHSLRHLPNAFDWSKIRKLVAVSCFRNCIPCQLRKSVRPVSRPRY